MSDCSIHSTESRRTSRGYDTGFPDSMASHTTSMRHPDADTSPNACISASDIDPARSAHRSRRHIIAKHRRTISHGSIPPAVAALQAQYSTQPQPPPAQHSKNMPSIDSAVDLGGAKGTDRSSIGQSSKGSDSIRRGNDPDVPIPSTEGHEEPRKTMNPFRKWVA